MGLQMLATRDPKDDAGILAPVVTCDGCGKQISDMTKANVMWRDDAYGLTGTLSGMWFVHKGDCDHRLCLRIDGDVMGPHMSWDEMTAWFKQLTYNLSHTPALPTQAKAGLSR